MFFPLKHWPSVSVSEVQASLQTAFEQWGRPSMMRFDNGKPWGNPRNSAPTGFALWLEGLDVQVRYGRPGQSTDNAVVECCHRVLNGWVEPHNCRDIGQLRQSLSEFATLQWQEYVGKGTTTRLERFPQLLENSRTYRRVEERDSWQVKRVFEYVGRSTFSRKVEKTGRMTLLTEEYTLPRQYAGMRVTVKLETESGEWEVKDQHGTMIKRLKPARMTYDVIANMRFTHADYRADLAAAKLE